MWGVHGMGGALGSVLIGCFSSKSVVGGGADAWGASGELIGK